MLGSILDSGAEMTLQGVALCTGTSLVLGLLIACVYMYRGDYSKNLVFTIALLPALVQSVIMIVNGNLGTGVAVMGAFGLVRFRSAPGSAREIASIFFAMSVGLATGMGYLAYAALFTVVIGAVMLLFSTLRFGEGSEDAKQLRVVIPEDLDYGSLFDDLFREFTRSNRLDKVRTTNLGSLYELQYTIQLRDPAREKQLLDLIRQRNGNLSVSCGRIVSKTDEL